MRSVFIWWVISAGILILAAWRTGHHASKGKVFGIFLDSRGRFSLSQFQIVLWTILVLSLLAGVFIARLFAGVAGPLNITIPNELLIVMGISVGSTTAASAVKASKDIKNVNIIGKDVPKFSQVYLAEEGTGPETVDITRFQNFWLTLIVVGAYLATAVAYIGAKTTVSELNSLPGFDGTLLTLLGISHAGYIAMKLPDKK